MPSTALCYDDSFPFSFSLLLVNCRMCVIKVGSVQSRVGENGARKSINFINTAVPFLLFVLHANRSLFCWIIAPRCFSASHQTRLPAHFLPLSNICEIEKFLLLVLPLCAVSEANSRGCSAWSVNVNRHWERALDNYNRWRQVKSLSPTSESRLKEQRHRHA